MSDRPDQPNEPPIAIHYDRVTKIYPNGNQSAVSDLSLDVIKGDLVVLLGPSGCGKTTLLKMTNRLIEPTTGSISIDGVEIHSLPAPELRRRIGYVIQQTGLFPHMRVEDNIAVVPKLLKWDRQRIHDRVDELLDLVGLPPAGYRRRYPAQLSGGEQQRVGLARALAVSPDTMLMDEPFGALDAITRSHLQMELRRIHQTLGQTIIFVTHDIDEAVRLADQIVIMREGRIVQSGDPLEIVTNPADAFVSELVGASDALRRLSLIESGTVATPLAAGIAPPAESIPASTDVRTAFGTMLGAGLRAIGLTDANGDLIGTIDLDTVREIARTHPVEVST
ncbi:MAG TPA: ABC transporter ATP-binding protein [Thermomicrobiales bacterium]|nr:ABC transporter ATP-binding protein [Thermomicrobiales bacterium]